MDNILNARITKTELGEDHGCLTAHIVVEGEAWGCGYGGYVLDRWCAEPGKYESRDGYGAIIELMKTVGVESWEANASEPNSTVRLEKLLLLVIYSKTNGFHLKNILKKQETESMLNETFYRTLL